MSQSFAGPIKVTVSDPETGKELESRVVSNDYVLICAGNRYVKSVQAMGKPGRATHMIAVAVRPTQPSPHTQVGDAEQREP